MLCVSATMWAAAARLDVGQEGLEEGEGGFEGRESADGVEQRADVMAAHEAEGDDGDEAMAGDEITRTSQCSTRRGAAARPAASRRGSVDGATGNALVTGSGRREAATGAERQMANANGGRRGERELSHERRE